MENKDNEIKASISFSLSVNPHPITKIESILSVRSKTQMIFMPAVGAKAALPGTNQEYQLSIPIVIVDAISDTGFEEMRTLLHRRIDESFDNFKTKWEKSKDATTAEAETKTENIKLAGDHGSLPEGG